MRRQESAISAPWMPSNEHLKEILKFVSYSHPVMSFVETGLMEPWVQGELSDGHFLGWVFENDLANFLGNCPEENRGGTVTVVAT